MPVQLWKIFGGLKLKAFKKSRWSMKLKMHHYQKF